MCLQICILVPMEKNDVARPISTILDGTNYITWVHQMRSFLIGRKLWSIVTGDITKPIKPTPLVKNTGNNANTSDVLIHETTAEDINTLKDLSTRIAKTIKSSPG